MKLSENTINILKNYAVINPSILVKTGSMLFGKDRQHAFYCVSSKVHLR